MLHGITVRSALQLDCFKGARVIAGENGLDRVITSVNVMEVPDILPWIKENELLLTTGFSIKDDPAAQERLIPELASRGLAALGFKPKRYVDIVPETMIAQANAYSFPLIEIPLTVSHSQLLQGVYSELVVRQASLLQKTAEVHEAVMNVLLKGGGLQEIVTTLEDLIANPSALFDIGGNLLNRSPGAAPSLEVIGTPPLGTAKYHRERFRPIRTSLESDGRKVGVTMAPVFANNRVYGEIVVWEVNSPLTPIDLIAIEKAASLVTLVILNRIAVQSVESRYRNEFLYDWLAGKFKSREELLHRASMIGWDLQNNYILMVIDIDGFAEATERYGFGSGEMRETKEKVQQAIISVMTHTRDYYILGDRGSHFVLLMRARATWSEQAIKEKIREVGSLIQRAVSGPGGEISCSIGVGRFCRDPRDMPECFHEAKKAVAIGRMLKGPGQVTHFDELGVHRLLHLVSNQGELDKFARETIAALFEYDREYGTELVPTLQAYFRCNGNVSKMARELFAHYNTVTYRLERIQEITGLSLDDPEHRLNLQVGLKIALLKQLS